jgi:hypothetical protein
MAGRGSPSSSQSLSQQQVRGTWSRPCGSTSIASMPSTCSITRYHKLFADRPPTIVAQFCERVPMVKGRWDPDATTAIAYAWFGWSKLALAQDETRLMLIPLGQRTALTRPDDRSRRLVIAATGQCTAAVR